MLIVGPPRDYPYGSPPEVAPKLRFGPMPILSDPNEKHNGKTANFAIRPRKKIFISFSLKLASEQSVELDRENPQLIPQLIRNDFA